MEMKKQQYDFLNWEFGVFFHFGIRTFYDVRQDWDEETVMPASGFNPSALDCGQWIRTAGEAGAKYTILVCKHHDGFALWPSKYTEYSVANAPWKEGKGDVVREYVNACRKYGMKVGLYYSPAEHGYRAKKPEDYDDYFINQISELLTNYGKIDYLWFDACGSENHSYDVPRIVREIRTMQPEILIFNMWDPDTRWCGNESGYMDSPNRLWVDETDFAVSTQEKTRWDKGRYLPAECDFRMRRHAWFYSEDEADTVKSLEELRGIYYYTVGRGANMLINIAPDRRGLLPREDCSRLLEFGKWVQSAFKDPISSDFVREGNVCSIELASPQLVNHVILRERPESMDSVQSFQIRAYPYPYGAPIVVYEGKTIGHKAICCFPAFYTSKVECVITGCTEEQSMAGMSVHYI